LPLGGADACFFKSKVVRPFDKDNFTGLIRLETLAKVARRDALVDRVLMPLDGGELHALSGNVMVNEWRCPSFHIPTRDLVRRSGRDAVDRAGRKNRAKLEEKYQRKQLNRDVFEKNERATDEVLQKRPVNEKIMEDAPFVHEQFRLRANVQSKVPMLQNECFAGILWKLTEKMEEAMKWSGTTKKPVILLGDKYGPAKGAHGVRGHMATPLVEYLAQFFLIILVPEHLTSLLCPQCHMATVFAANDSYRGKLCKDCCVARKDFFFDRDFGAPINIHFKAEYFLQSGGFFPPQYITKKELEKRKELVTEFLSKLLIARQIQASKAPTGP
jgi:hypothetical protein